MASDPIFVKVRNDQGKIYDSYTDFWTLINLSEFPTCELDEVDKDSDNTYIFLPNNGNVEACCKRPHTARYILWQIERPSVVGNIIPDCFDEQWVSDRAQYNLIASEMAQQASEDSYTTYPENKFVVLGGHKGLGVEPREPKYWDFVHLAYLYGDRERRCNEIAAQGFTMAPNGWGEVRDKSLAHSKFGLMLHQDGQPYMTPLRAVLFACSQLPIVAEPCIDPYPYYVYPVSHFTSVMNVYDPESWAEANYKNMTEEFTFRKCVMEAL